jgi:hypothetical protein
MKTMYERIKDMTAEEMQQFVYWVYQCGNRDGFDGCEDSPSGYFGGYLLSLPVTEVMPNDNINDLWKMYREMEA